MSALLGYLNITEYQSALKIESLNLLALGGGILSQPTMLYNNSIFAVSLVAVPTH